MRVDRSAPLLPRLPATEADEPEPERPDAYEAPLPTPTPPPLRFEAAKLASRQLEAVLRLALEEGGRVHVGLPGGPHLAVTGVDDRVHFDAGSVSFDELTRGDYVVRLDDAPEAEQAARDHVAQHDFEAEHGVFERDVWHPLVRGWHRLQARWFDSRARGQARVLEILERIEAGEGVPRRLETVPGEIAGYFAMDPERRTKLLNRLRESVPTNIANAARADQAAAEIPHSPLLDRLARTVTIREAYDVLTADGLDAVEVASQVFFSSVASQPDVFAAGALGAWIGGPWGARIAAGAASFGSEYGFALRESLVAHGVDVTDAAAVIEAWRDPELMASVESFAERRAAAVSVFATIGYGSPFGRGVGGQTANLAFQTGVDTSGEAVAQLWSTGAITEPGEVLLEGIGGLVTSPVELVTAGVEPMDVLWRSQEPQFGDPLPFHVLRNPTPGTRSDAEVDAANRAVLDGHLGAPVPLEASLIQRLPGWETVGTNEAYGHAAAQLVTELRQGIAVGGIHSFQDALDFVSLPINQIMRDLERTDVWDQREFGRPRTATSSTPMTGKYEGYQAPSVESLDVFGEETWRATEDGIRLTTHEGELVFSNGKRRSPSWSHPPPSSFDAILEKAEVAWSDARGAESPRALVDAVANLHWWGANMNPFERSSAAAIDIIAKALLVEGGVQPGRWREGIGADLEAFFQSREAFVEAYASYHEP
ncbi:MAG: hypothetical protein RMA76_25930 [Deltaproteobacteria bacterium]|jgi:hypothetical protein